MRMHPIPIPESKLHEHFKKKQYENKERVDILHQRSRLVWDDQNKNSIERKKRLDQLLCVVCFYIDYMRIGCAAITLTDCRLCGKEMQFGSTATNDFCEDCAKKHHMCKECGAPLDLKKRF